MFTTVVPKLSTATLLDSSLTSARVESYSTSRITLVYAPCRLFKETGIFKESPTTKEDGNSKLT